MGLSELPTLNANLSTTGLENSLYYVGESLAWLMEYQQNVNCNMVEHLNATATVQEEQVDVLVQLVKNTCQREFDK